MNTFFNSKTDRELWIRLNAERQIEWEKSLTYFNFKTGKNEPTLQALNPRSIEEALEISKNQLEYDEKIGKLRHTLAELLTLNNDELIAVRKQQFEDFTKKLGSFTGLKRKDEQE